MSGKLAAKLQERYARRLAAGEIPVADEETPALACQACGTPIASGSHCIACAALRLQMIEPRKPAKPAPTPATSDPKPKRAPARQDPIEPVASPVEVAEPTPAVTPAAVEPDIWDAPVERLLIRCFGDRWTPLAELLDVDRMPEMRAGHERAIRAEIRRFPDSARLAPEPTRRPPRPAPPAAQMPSRTKNGMEWPPERVRALRTQLGQTRKEFAATVGTSVPTVGNWERGFTAPKPAYWPKLAELEASAA